MDTIIYLMLQRKYNKDRQLQIWQKGTDPHLVYAELPGEWLEEAMQALKEEDSEEGADAVKALKQQRLAAWPAELFGMLKPFLGKCSSIDTIYDPAVDRWLKKGELRGWWERAWPAPEYREYRRESYAALLFGQASEQFSREGRPLHVMVLGYEEYLGQLLSACARRLKSLSVTAQKCSECLEQLQEELYEEYGLAVRCRLLEPSAEKRTCFQGFSIESSVPCIVLDASGEEKLGALGLPCGSIWIDLDSMEEKRRRLLAGNNGIFYVSMRRIWERQGKREGRREWQER